MDANEERPLIWKAAVQLKAGSLADAEATLRRAIAIDPSDGEQGPNDRMRAYAVLSELLTRKGDKTGAETYAKAVTAIRMSERADGLHEAGLYQRAFAEYRAALEQFSDAYCIQSRLAVQLYKQGRRNEALEHYRRAYELMPDSFGRVESHCFGCESVFQGEEAQSIAEKVFTESIRKNPGKAQAHYLLAYLREQQGRAAEAVAPLRNAVRIDPQYLNAWKHLNDVGRHAYIEPWETDIARLKLLELDPLQRHVTLDLDDVGDLAALWRGAQRASGAVHAAKPIRADVYPLKASADALAKARAALPPEMLEQMDVIQEFSERGPQTRGEVRSASAVVRDHVLVQSARRLLGGEETFRY
jgi:tetratricopeptide (TPR) repeat protein